MNIINIIGTPDMGGVQNGIIALAEEDKVFNINRTIICLYPKNKEKRGIFIDYSDIELKYCTIFYNKPIFRPYFFWKYLRKFSGLITFPFRFYSLVKKIKPDVVINEEPIMIAAQVLICKIISVPFIIHMEKELNYQKNFRFFNYILKNTFFISASIKTTKFNLGSQNPFIINKNTKIPIIPPTSPFDVKFKNIKIHRTDTFIHIGTIGRVVTEKNFKQLISICKIINDNTNIDYKISIAGEGPLLNALEKNIKVNNLENQIILLGKLNFSEINSFLHELDIYIQTSISESGPITIKEAMFCSLPVISTAVGFVPDIIDNGVNGFIVPINDSQSFSKTLIKVMNMSQKEKSMIGSKARKKILENHTTKEHSLNYLNTIKYFIKIYSEARCVES